MIKMAEEWDRLADKQERASRSAADAIRPKTDPPGGEIQAGRVDRRRGIGGRDRRSGL
jgi:hypothetical protein